MDPIILATLGGLGTALFYGTADWLSGKGSKKYDRFEMNLAVQVGGLVLPAILFLLVNAPVPSLSQQAAMATAAAFIATAYILFLKALSKGSVGIVVPLGSIYPLFTLLLSLIFLGTVFTLGQVAAMVLIVLGAFILAYEKNHQKIPLKELHYETVLALLAAVGWGAGFFIINSLIGELKWQVINCYVSIFLTIIGAIFLLISKPKRKLAGFGGAFKNWFALIIGLLFSLDSISLYLGSEQTGNLIIPVVVGSSGPLVASFWAAVIDKEKIGRFKRTGAVVVVAGIVLLNL